MYFKEQIAWAARRVG